MADYYGAIWCREAAARQRRFAELCNDGVGKMFHLRSADFYERQAIAIERIATLRARAAHDSTEER